MHSTNIVEKYTKFVAVLNQRNKIAIYRNAAIGDDCAGHKNAMLFLSATFRRLKSSPDVIRGGTACSGSESETKWSLFQFCK